MVTLKNDVLQVDLEPTGAEISRIIGLQDGLNYMWKQDPVLWGHSAPVLFPIIGGLRNGTMTHEGKTYKMGNHGFARNTVFGVDEQDDTHVVFHIHETEETLAQYPFCFDLYVTYTLEDNKLHTEFKVVNERDDVIYFSIGGHPAFACPLIEGEDYNEYYIEMEQPETMSQKVIDPSAGAAMLHEEKPLFENERRLFVRQAPFSSDAIVLQNMKSSYLTLKSLCNDKSVVFHMNNFLYCGLWTSKHAGGLLAIEPWNGHCDYIDYEGEFKDREGTRTLKKGEQFVCDFTVEINQ